ncbi:MAG: ABC transporter permease [Arenicella sp.]
MNKHTESPSSDLLKNSVGEFTSRNSAYYIAVFEKIQSVNRFPWSWNSYAALIGPFWGAARGLWGYFWTFMMLELLAFVQLGKGLWGDLGAEKMARVERLTHRYQELELKAQAAIAAGEDAQGLLKTVDNLKTATQRVTAEAEELASGSINYIIAGVVILVLVKLIQGFYANLRYEKQYLKWRADPQTIPSGFSWAWVACSAVLWMAIVPMTLYRFTVTKPVQWVLQFPVDKELFTPWSKAIDNGFDWMSSNFAGMFDTVVVVIRYLLNGLETVFVSTPWPVVMTVILVTAWRLAGPRVAVFTAAALSYLAFLGLWETSMVTVALLGAAAALCVVIGIPLGIWFGKNKRAYNAALPVLDFMQTMPAFVYLIPIIAFFGTGKPPGVLATIVFGMPPVIRLTALGMQGVPEETKEAAIAYGATRWTLLKDVEIPLAMPSIMTGVNQTILMCLSMVVIASLIGAGGLGKNVLEALQYAAKGQGLLAGLAILFCAMVIDRIVQGHYSRTVSRQ